MFEHMNTGKSTDFLVHMKKNHHDPVFHGVAQLFLLVRQKLYSSQLLKTEQINELSNWTLYCIPHVQRRCIVSEMPRNVNVLFRSWCCSLDHESKISKKMRLCELQFIFTDLLSCCSARSMHKDYIFGSLFSIKYAHISPNTPPVLPLFWIQTLVIVDHLQNAC